MPLWKSGFPPLKLVVWEEFDCSDLALQGGGCVGSCYMEKAQKSPGPLVLFP